MFSLVKKSHQLLKNIKYSIYVDSKSTPNPNFLKFIP